VRPSSISIAEKFQFIWYCGALVAFFMVKAVKEFSKWHEEVNFFKERGKIMFKKFMGKIICIILFLVYTSLIFVAESQAANYYISNSAKGTQDCSSWSNACTVADISAGGRHKNLFTNGNNFYFDGGESGMTYNSPEFTTDAAGTDWTTGVTFATGAKSPSPSGHDGYVTFNGNGRSTGFIRMFNISNFTLDGEKNGAINWKFYNMLTYATDNSIYSYALQIRASELGRAKNVTVKYVWVDTADSGMSFMFQTGIDIHHNKITNIYHEVGLDVRGLSGSAPGTNKVHDNQIEYAYDTVAWSSGGRHGTCPNATGFGPDAIQASGNVDIYNNIIASRSGVTYHCQHPDAIQADWYNTRVYNNSFLGGPSLFQNSHERNNFSGDVTNLWIYNNVAIGYNNGMQLLIGGYGTKKIDRVYLLNNTIMNTGQGGLAISGNSAILTNVEVRNNIFHNADWNDGGSANEMIPTQCAAIVYSNNVVNGGSLRCNGNNVTNTNGQTRMPSFVNYIENNPASDVHLADGDTVAKDHGVSLSSYFNTDKDGSIRSGTWDIGAYEGSGSGLGMSEPTGSEITAPKSVRIVN
jgi:hypothetical protein